MDMNAPAIQNFQRVHMTPNEQLLGVWEVRLIQTSIIAVPGFLLVTSNRVVFNKDDKKHGLMKQMNHEKITSVLRVSAFFQHEVHIEGGSNEELKIRANKKTDLEPIVATIGRARAFANSHSAPQPATHPQTARNQSSVDDLHQLWTLVKEGVLTREEFEDAKHKHLGATPQPIQRVIHDSSAGPHPANADQNEQANHTQTTPNKHQPTSPTPEPLLNPSSAANGVEDGPSKFAQVALVAVLGFVLLAICAGLLGSQNKHAASTSSTRASTPTPAPSSPAKPSPQRVEIGKTLQTPDWQIRFANPSASTANGPSTARPGHVFLTVLYTLSNRDAKPNRDPMTQLIVESNGQTYKNRNQLGDTSYVATIEPGEEQQQWQTFEIPRKVIESDFNVRYINSDTSVFFVPVSPNMVDGP